MTNLTPEQKMEQQLMKQRTIREQIEKNQQTLKDKMEARLQNAANQAESTANPS